MYLGTLSDTSMHRHHAAQVCIAIGEPFQINLGGKWHRSSYAAIPANQPHQLNGSLNPLILLLIDSATMQGRQISSRPHEIRLSFSGQLPKLPKTVAMAKVFSSTLLSPNPDRPAKTTTIDGRIRDACLRINELIDGPVSADKLARYVNLSESRFLHLFSDSLGLPLRRYVLWRRIIGSIEAVIAGADLTTAAHMGGFSDSAHFSRTFRKTFGLSPSSLFNNSRNIQVIT